MKKWKVGRRISLVGIFLLVIGMSHTLGYSDSGYLQICYLAGLMLFAFGILIENITVKKTSFGNVLGSIALILCGIGLVFPLGQSDSIYLQYSFFGGLIMFGLSIIVDDIIDWARKLRTHKDS